MLCGNFIICCYITQADSLRSRVSQLEEEVRVQAARYNEASDDYRQQHQQYNQLR